MFWFVCSIQITNIRKRIIYYIFDIINFMLMFFCMPELCLSLCKESYWEYQNTNCTSCHAGRCHNETNFFVLSVWHCPHYSKLNYFTENELDVSHTHAEKINLSRRRRRIIFISADITLIFLRTSVHQFQTFISIFWFYNRTILIS